MEIQYGRQGPESGVVRPVTDYEWQRVPCCVVNINSAPGRKRRRRWKRPRGKRGGYSKFQRSIRSVINVFPRSKRHCQTRNRTLVPIQYLSSYDSKQCLNFSLWNARSMNDKIGALTASIIANRTDVFVLTESWVTEKNGVLIDADFSSSVNGYTTVHVPRYRRRGGGIALLIRSNLKVKRNSCDQFKSFEILDVNIYVGSIMIHVVSIYRPPYSKQHKYTFNCFLTEFGSLMESLITSPGYLLILGDFNIHVDNATCQEARQFIDLITSLGLTQHVNGSTHKKGHTLDLIFTRASESWLGNFVIDHSLPSDHSAVHCTSMINKPKPSKVTKQHRVLRSIDSVAMEASLRSSIQEMDSSVDDVNQLTSVYNSALMRAIDEHAPLRAKTTIEKPRAEWFTADLLSERRALRTLERQWQKSGLEVHHQMYCCARSKYNQKLEETKASFHRHRIAAADTKELFNIVDSISGSKKSLTKILPNDIETDNLPDVFANFFTDKIIKIRNSLQNVSSYVESSASPQCTLDTFEIFSLSEIHKIVSQMPSKSCELDPMPTQLVKENIDVLAPLLQRIVNSSFQSGVFPEQCKSAIVRPLLKKLGLDPNILKNYRPLSNCSFLDKFMEKCAFMRLNSYLTTNNLYGKFQSAYREGHSTETALLRVMNDVVLSLDVQHDVILVLLDLSAAFDTIDHDILLERLRSRYGICGKAHDWFETFLRGRTQRVSVGSMVSECHSLTYGVPQGSVLGPVLFSLYMTPVEDIITGHGLSTVIYADDTQLYIACDSRDDNSVIPRIEACVDEIRDWMQANLLALNDAKTEIVRFISRTKRSGAVAGDVRVGEASVSPVSGVRDLGVMVDSAGLMDEHIKSVCCGASHSLWRIGKIRHLLDQASTEKLVHGFITAKLDYCNSLLFGLPKYKIQKLQHIQNSAARLVTRRSLTRHESITPILCELHWLPVEVRIQFKLLCIIFKLIRHSELAPWYLSSLIRIQNGNSRTRAATGVKLTPFSLKSHGKQTSIQYGDRAFSVAAPKLWNELPLDLRSITVLSIFKSHLKTFLFKRYYSSH